MNPEKQRIAIAEACGWLRGSPGEALRDPSGKIVNAWYNEEWRLPDYLNDLNAMHEAEKILDAMPMDKQSMYLDYLYCAVGWDDANNARDAKLKCYYGSVRATAAQRAEAFLRTIGKWEDNE